MPAAVRLVHPAPTAAVVALSAALAAILASQAAGVPISAVILVTLAIAGSQVATGAMNDWADRARDARIRPTKPIAAGEITPTAALAIAGLGAAVQVVCCLPLGSVAMLVGLAALASAQAYNLALSRTPFSVVPYLVSFGLLPAWIAAGLGLPIERVAPAIVLVMPFAAAAHLANVLRDWEIDRSSGSRNLAQLLGPRLSHAVALLLALAVGLGVAGALAASGQLRPANGALGVVGLLAVVQGAGSARRLWYGILVAAVSWTAAWALATG